MHVQDQKTPTVPTASSVLSENPHPSHLVKRSTHEQPDETFARHGAWTTPEEAPDAP